MKHFLAIILMSVLFVSCSGNSNVKTITADLLASGLSTATIQTFDCAAVDVVKADVKATVDKWFQTNQQSEKGIVQDLCKTAIASIVPQLIGTALPTTWQCKITKIDTAAALLSELACSKINI
jgi:uncharacterized metal-binding protein